MICNINDPIVDINYNILEIEEPNVRSIVNITNDNNMIFIIHRP
jgi:hypothetical protein